MPAKVKGLDTPIWGAANIAAAAGLFKKDKKTGKKKLDERKGFYLLESGAIRAKQVKGRDEDGNEKTRGQWVTTLRLIRESLLPIEA
jgi:hypothetical protein